MENQGQRRIWKPKKDYKSNTPSKFVKGVFLPKDMKKKFEVKIESTKEEIDKSNIEKEVNEKS